MKKGFSLVEMLVVVGIIAVLVGLTIPAINALQKSYDSTGADSMISAALATARTLAISNHNYAGVRFQKAYNKKGPLEADQYMIFIVYAGHDVTNWDCGFIAKEGYKPIKLPANIGVMDKMVRTSHTTTSKHCDQVSENSLVAANLTDDVNITDTSAFSIVFSPAGKLVIYVVRCRDNDYTAANIKDDVFNTQNNVELSQIGMFIEDDCDTIGLGVENSRTKFVIYDRDKFKTMTTATQRGDYISGLKPMYINPYTGQIIEK